MVDTRVVTSTGEHERLCNTLARAFQNEEACSHIFPDEASRSAQLLKMFRVIIKSDTKAGSLIETAGGEAVTLWRAPGRATGGAIEFAASLLPFLLALGSGIGRGLQISTAIEAHHPKTPFCYLHFAGCEPIQQSKGFGGAAIRAGIARADAEHSQCYLETATESNLQIYAGMGFDLIADWQISRGPKFWGMLRPAR